MSLRSLFGPVAAGSRPLPRAAAADQCGFFSRQDLQRAGSWEGLCAQVPGGGRPDFLVLDLAYKTLPAWLWQVPVPLVGLAADAQLQWHWYRRVLPRCEAVLADAPTVERLHRQGITQARPAVLFGLDPAFLTPPAEELPRDVDLVFVGNMHPAIHRARLAWLGRLARLSGRWRVRIATGVHGADYHALLWRSRIVCNCSVRGECNMRALEAAACGCLLLQDAGSTETAALLRDGQECVLYSDRDLEERIDYYLTNEEERRTIAEAARAKASGFTFEALWEQALAALGADWPALQERVGVRPRPGEDEGLLARTWEAVATHDGADPALAADLLAALSRRSGRADLHNALGLTLTLLGQGSGPATAALAQVAASHFRDAVTCDPRHLVAALNLVEALAAVGQEQVAAEGARRALAALARGHGLTPGALDAMHFPPGYDHFRVEWERAAWDHPGDPAGEAQAKRELLRWRLHGLLADLSGEASHYYEAALARPDLPPARAALGCALGRAGQPVAAVEHLRVAAEANPFDRDATRALCQALSETGDEQGARRLARDRRLLAEAAPGLVPAEDWFTKAPPPGDELASLLILCCNEVAVTRLCLESVLRHTRPPYELILVDNGSSDATPALLKEAASCPGPERVVVLRNEENKGFAAGCNQALAAAQGDYLVLLNNDTVVTPGWLDRLVAWSLHEWPKVGLVGPVSNHAPEPQYVPPGYESLAGLDAFTAKRRQEYVGKALWAERLTGFCLLVRREVLKKVGALDEQFAGGFFEDDDLCFRARDAGFGLLVALDTYLHHFGSQTFKGLGIDTEQALRHNFARFQQKWGAERTAGYRLPGRHDTVPAPATGAAPALPPEKLFPGATGKRVTLSMIVKNEEKNLPDCLRSVLDLVDNAIINDTGSNDRTREIAASFGSKVKVVSTTWPDSFAEARNESLRHATGDWIFWMDADDRLDEPNREKLRALFASLKNENVAYTMKCLCLPDPESGVATTVDHVRLFRNHPSLRWEYRVHEQILPAVRRLGGEVRWADVVITHIGYQDLALRARKLQRDLALLNKDLAKRPDDPFCLFNLGSILHEQGHYAQAIPVLRRSLANSHSGDSIVRKLYSLVAACHKSLGQYKEALAACREGRGHCPGDAELLFWEAKMLSDLGSWDEAKACCLELLSSKPGRYFASVDAGLRGYRGRHLLAVIYYRQGHHDLAKAQWGLVVGEQPDFLPGWLGLGETALAQGDGNGLEAAARRLEALPGGPLEAGLLRARGRAARGDFAAGRELLGRLREAYPREVEPRLALGRLLLQEGRDLEAAERALHDVLLLDPAQPEAQARLADLLRRKKRTEDAVFEAKGNVLGWVLAERYEAACLTPSDINEHLPTLHALAKECPHVTELGTRTGISTLALLWAQPKKLVCYDLVRYPEVDHLQAMAGQTEFIFRQQDVLEADIEETDLLFIDTWHVYQQLKAELRRHAAQARRYIVLHDTTTYGAKGETEGHQGLWRAVEELLAEGTFRLKQRFENNNGLTVLERVSG